MKDSKTQNFEIKIMAIMSILSAELEEKNLKLVESLHAEVLLDDPDEKTAQRRETEKFKYQTTALSSVIDRINRVLMD